MNKIEREKMVKAMEFIARHINDEEVFMGWLMVGVADEDIPYGDLEVTKDNAGWLDSYYEDNDSFAELMDTFLRKMAQAYKDGGLYCDRVVSGRAD